MKKVLRKATSVLCILALVLSYASIASFAEQDTNIAGNAAVDASSWKDEFVGSNLTDGDPETYWQAAGTENEWFGFTWKEKQSISKICLHWGGGRPHKDDITIKIPDGNGGWTAVSEEIKRTDGDDIYHHDDVIEYDKHLETNAIRVYMAKPEVQDKYSLQCWEVEIYGTPVAPAGDFEGTKQFESAAISGEDGLVDRLVVTNVGDASFDEDDVVQITYTITRQGLDPVTQSEYLYEAWTAIAMNLDNGPTEITAKSLGGSESQYVTGMIFYDLLSTDDIVVTFKKVKAPAEE